MRLNESEGCLFEVVNITTKTVDGRRKGDPCLSSEGMIECVTGLNGINWPGKI